MYEQRKKYLTGDFRKLLKYVQIKVCFFNVFKNLILTIKINQGDKDAKKLRISE